jgi:type I restriction enzyme S subunit
MTVQQVPLGEVIHRVARTVKVDASSTYPNVGLLNRARGVFEKPELRGAETKYKTLYRLATGDLVYSKLFGWEGAVALVPDWADGACVSGEFPTYSLSSRIDRAYLGHVIAWEGFASQMAASTTGMGQRRQRVNPGQFERIAIPLPDLSEQQRIAARLERVAETSRASGDLKEFELSWRHLVERLTFGSPTSLQRMGDVLRPKSMELVDHDSDYQIAGVYSFGRGLLSRGTLKGADTKYKSFTRLDPNDVVYSKLGAFEGAVAVVPASYNGFYVSPEFPVFEFDEGAYPTFVRYCVIAESFVRQLVAASSGVGARQKRVSPKAFLDLSVPVPPLDEQREIARGLDLASQALQLKRDAVRIRQALLPAARNDAFAKLT